jgi:hypothetical protein
MQDKIQRPDMSSTSLGNPTSVDSSRSANGHGANGTRDKSSKLRSAVVGDGLSGKKGAERVWRSGIVAAEDKLKGDEGQRVVVGAW